MGVCMRGLFVCFGYDLVYDPLDDAHLRLLERRRNADLLGDVDLYLLLGDPIAAVLQEVQGRLGVPGLRRGEQHRRHLALPVGRALLDRCGRQRVEFLQPAQLRRSHIGSIGEIVTFEAQFGRVVERAQSRLGGAERAIAERHRLESHSRVGITRRLTGQVGSH